MNKQQLAVLWFMRRMNELPRPDGIPKQAIGFERHTGVTFTGGKVFIAEEVSLGPAIRDPDLRASLIEEEARETVEAIRAGDLVEAVDGLCDLLYVIYGAAVSFGIDLDPFFDEVDYSNESKLVEGAEFRADGKLYKSPRFKPPRIAAMLKALTPPETPEAA